MVTRISLEWLDRLLGAGCGPLPAALLVPVLPPAPQLEVDEAPHHRGLEEAHQQQHTHSEEDMVEEKAEEIPFLWLQGLVLHSWQPKADDQDVEG